MKAQWQLVNIETKDVIATLGEPFDLIEERIKEEWERQVDWTGTAPPVGILVESDEAFISERKVDYKRWMPRILRDLFFSGISRSNP